MPLNNQTIRGMDGVLSAHRQGLHGKSAHCSVHCGLLVNFVREWSASEVETRVEDERRRRFKGCFYPINHGIYVRELARAQCRKLVSKGKPRGLLREPSPTIPLLSPFSSHPGFSLSTSDLNDHSSGNNIRADIVGRTER